ISLIRRRELARLLSVFPQGRPVPDMAAGEMVLMGRYPFRRGFAAFSDDDVAMAEKALVSADASEFGGRNMKALSYGERQRVYLAMQMAQDTRNCVLDEPTNFMDASHSFQILDYVKRMSAEEGKCVVCVLHDIPLAMRYADRLVILKNGGIYADGAPDELFEGGDIARAFNIRLERFSVNGGYAYSVLPG
ncbi:MAG: ABC transporter ATP-binding protein, partial [Clostridia bacterium]|nr:ABC transporter ATP-binding protein [Clostridia bacterium]